MKTPMRASLPKPILFCESWFTPTNYEDLTEIVNDGAPERPTIVDFTNTHIAVLRLTDPSFRRWTDSIDYFVPDSTPLTWCVNAVAGTPVMPERVYGPEFMRLCLKEAPATTRHYFLGGTEECLADLISRMEKTNPHLNICGSHHGYLAKQEWPEVCSRIKTCTPDIIWVGLGTPRQQEFSSWLKSQLEKGWLLNVGFAFDVNAGHKSDAPKWMQSLALTWLYRLACEPKRLGPRYVKFNSLFLLYACEWFMKNNMPTFWKKTVRRG